ncbi:unnamed protein product [Acanthoscelides obtectus]|uniref:HTH psq-type domain-containing protein n=1 Tax=Acanthoscelides obtectus TaxID=200917 RepID=A0A9P0VTD7_ACAOB|nr:unnamed protein product [Acanthoscelides obtectus]CAK1689106.1 hypothetical protein AOBTE_LOCUS37013 [Acanthoscelides obtectus]
MPRKYKRRVGSRRYADYTAETLQMCLAEIRSGDISHRKAEQKYKIPRRTILNKLKGNHCKKPGKQPIFTSQEEHQFVECIVALGEYGFPINSRELRHIIKNYLSRCGREVKTFQDNLSGQDWTNAFIIRHPEISIRFAENIKRTRAAVDEPLLRSFFENLAGELKDVPPSNVWNFDETNLTDDPGKKKVLVKKGTKYPKLLEMHQKHLSPSCSVVTRRWRTVASICSLQGT